MDALDGTSGETRFLRLSRYRHLGRLKRFYLSLVGVVAVLLLAAGCSDDIESGLEGERRETKPGASSSAETNGSAPTRVKTVVKEDGLHFEVGRYEIDAPPGVAPVGTSVEAVAFDRESSEVAQVRGQSPEGAEVAFDRISSRTAQASPGAVLENSGRGFKISMEGNAQPNKLIHVSAPTEKEYTASSLKDAGPNDTVPVMLREIPNGGVVWGPPVYYDPEKSTLEIALSETGSALYEGAIDIADVANKVSQGFLAGRTPQPECHGQAEETPSGGRVSIKFHNSVVAWACLDADDEYVTVDLTNTYTSPLVVTSDPSAALQHPSMSTGDALMVELSSLMGHYALPVQGQGSLTFPLDSLPATVELDASNFNAISTQGFTLALDIAAMTFKSDLLKKLLKSKDGLLCAEGAIQRSLGEAFSCLGLIGGPVATVIGILAAGAPTLTSMMGGIADEAKGPSYLTINYEPGSNDDCAGAAERLRAEQPNVQDGTFESYLNFIPDVGGCVIFEGLGPNLPIGALNAPVYDPDTGGELGMVKDLDPDLSSGDFSVTYQEFCGAFPTTDGMTAQEYHDQRANTKEQSILDPDGDGRACTSDDEAFLTGDAEQLAGQKAPQCINGILDRNGDGQIGSIEAAQAGADATQDVDPCTVPERGEDSSEDSDEEANLDQDVGDYYRAAGAGEWAYTYDHLASQTQSMFTEEEWSRKNQWFWDRNPVVYHTLSTNLDSTSEEPLAEVEVRITGEDGSSWTRTPRFVLEDGEWKHLFSDAEADLFMPGIPFEEFVAAQTGGSPEGDGDEVCAEVPDCEVVDTADVDGDGSLDEVALVGEPDEYPGTPTSISVRALLADGTMLTREIEVEFWHRDTAWHGAADFGQVPGEELVIGGTSGAHTLWFRVLTYRDGELVELPYPGSDPARADSFYATMWPIDAALSAYVGVQCQNGTVNLRSVSPVGAPGDGVPYGGEATSWVLEGDQWQMVTSEPLAYPDGSSAFEIAGWQCGDLPRAYD
jgi:hypothetical protein